MLQQVNTGHKSLADYATIATRGLMDEIRRLAEPLQTDTALMSRLRRAGVQPGAAVTVSQSATGLLVGSGGETTEITSLVASHVFVSAN